MKKLIITLVAICFSACVMAVELPVSEPFFSIDFRKPEYKATAPFVFNHDSGTEFNPTCGRSWKIDKYNKETNEFSYMEIELPLTIDQEQEYALEILACARKDPPLLSNVTITVNDHVIAAGYHMYNGPDSIHFADETGKPHHMRWDVFQISEALHDGVNKIRISLDKDTQSGISMSWLHLRTFPKG